MQGRNEVHLAMAALLGLAACSLDADPSALYAEGPAGPEGLEPVEGLTAASRGTQQTPGFDLTIAKSGADIALSWADQGASEYQVWTSDQPYFQPGDASSMMLAGGLAGLSYDEVGGNDDVERYYRVVAVDGAEGLSTIAGKIAYDLEPGYTKLGLCLVSEIDTSAELVADMNSGTLSTHTWDEVTQQWNTALAADAPGLSFGVGEMVSVHHDPAMAVTPDTYSMVGLVPVEDDVMVELLPGDNLVTTLPMRYDDVMASDLLATIDGGLRIGAWDAAAQTTTWYPDDGDFLLPRCSPLHVEVDAPSSWPPPPLTVVASPSCTNYEGAPVPLQAVASDGTGNYTYAWTPNDGTLSATDQATVMASPTGIQSYSVTVDDGLDQATDSVVVVDNNAFDLQNNCTLYQGDMVPAAPASITYDQGGTRACELGNNDFGLHLCEDVVFENVQLVGQLEVLSGTGDDDIMGLVWGAQDNSHFYSLTWKAYPQVFPAGCTAEGGITVKRVDAVDFASIGDDDIFCAIETSDSIVLAAPSEFTTAPWVAGESYTVTIEYQNTGSMISVTRDSDGVVIGDVDIEDSTYPSGFFGSTTISQTNACVGPLFASCL